MKKVWMMGSVAMVAGGLMLSAGCGTTRPPAQEPVSPVVMPPTTPEVVTPKVEEVKPPVVAEVTTKSYTVKAGDSISLIAKRFKVPSKDILKLNNISNANKIRVGQKLTLPGYVDLGAPAPAVKATHKKVAAKAGGKSAAAVASGNTYVVKSGDSLGAIAHANKTTVRALKQVNNLASDKLHVGQKLALPKGAAAAAPAAVEGAAPAPAEAAPAAVEGAAPAPAVEDPAAMAPKSNEVLHVVEPNQDLGSIAMMYGVRAEEVLKLNNLTSPDVKVGQTLKIPPPAE